MKASMGPVQPEKTFSAPQSRSGQASSALAPQGPKRAHSLHRRILSDIEDKILSGEWAPGHRIPFEHELTTHYGCSRMTVNKVLTQLAGAGLIERRRKAGSFVLRPRSQSVVLEIHDIGTEVSALGVPYRFSILRRRERRSLRSDADRLDLPKQSPVLDLTCCHFAGTHPFCLEERIINLAAVPEAAAEEFSDLPPGTWLVRRVPWTTAEHRIMAAAAEAETASVLKVAERTPCLVVERRTWSAEQPITFVRLTYPGDAHRLVARFEPPKG